MHLHSRHLHRTVLLGFTVTAFFAIVLLFEGKNARVGLSDRGIPIQIAVAQQQSEEYPATSLKSKQTFDRLNLTDEECTHTFPDLTRDIQDASQRGKFILNKSEPDYKGLVQGRIKNNHLYILSTAPDFTPEIIHQRTSILHQIHRAMLTSPTPLPDTHFAFVINDSPRNNSWAFSRPNKHSSYNIWLMPLFGFWSWKSQKEGLGTMDEVLNRIQSVEDSTPWEKKSSKVIWRGTPWFNPIGYQRLRQDLLKATKDQSWADVQVLHKEDGGNRLSIEDFCRHKYVVYTEGVTYSGRLPYHQACGSVLITAPLTYLTHTAWWMRPISAETLMAEKTNGNQSTQSHTTPLLPTEAHWEQANSIYINPSFSDLGSLINFLEHHPHIAKTIARNQRSMVAEEGYLSPAAESCYWRALIRDWAENAVLGHSWGDDMGVRFEAWITREMVRGRSEGTRGRIELKNSR